LLITVVLIHVAISITFVRIAITGDRKGLKDPALAESFLIHLDGTLKRPELDLLDFSLLTSEQQAYGRLIVIPSP